MNGQTGHLTQAERDDLKAQLNEGQLAFVKDYLKRGRRTAFANVLAKDKAASIAEEELGAVAEQWELIDYIDAGPRWRENKSLFCECGRPLRYQYILENKKTGDMKKFGRDHFQEHTGIPASLAKKIVKGIEKIDYEMDEVLLKLVNGWTLADEGIGTIPSGMEIPRDIQQHFDVGLPLLDRQVRRLHREITDFHYEQKRAEIAEGHRKQEEERKRMERETARIREEVASKMGLKNAADLDVQRLEVGTMVYLEGLKGPNFKASELCEDLATYHGASKERFSSGKLKIFPEVCSYLEHLVEKGVLQFVEKYSDLDRAYKLVDLRYVEKDEKMNRRSSQMDLFG